MMWMTAPNGYRIELLRIDSLDTQTSVGLVAAFSNMAGNRAFPRTYLVGGNGLEPLTLSV